MKPTKERFDDAKEEKEAVTRRRAGNIMAKIIRTKEQTTIYKTTHHFENVMVTTMTWLTATKCLCQKIMFVFRLS
jgi:hypothetical protein